MDFVKLAKHSFIMFYSRLKCSSYQFVNRTSILDKKIYTLLLPCLICSCSLSAGTFSPVIGDTKNCWPPGAGGWGGAEEIKGKGRSHTG